MPSESRAEAIPPEPLPAGRPALLSGRAWTPPLRPSLTQPGAESELIWSGGGYLGAFKAVGVHAGAAAERAPLPFGAEAGYEHPARRIKAGRTQRAVWNGASAFNVGKSVWLSPALGFQWDEVRLPEWMDQTWFSLHSYSLGISATPITVGRGCLSGGVYLDRWRLVDDNQGAYWRGRLDHSRAWKGGWLESSVDYTAEPTSGISTDLRLLKLGTNYRHRLRPNLYGWGGVKFYNGMDAGGDAARGGLLIAGMEFKVPTGAVISLESCPDARILPSRDWLKEFPNWLPWQPGFLLVDDYHFRLSLNMAEGSPWSSGFTLETLRRDLSIPRESRELNMVEIHTGVPLPGLGDEGGWQVWALGADDGYAAYAGPVPAWAPSLTGRWEESPYLPRWSLGLIGMGSVAPYSFGSDITWQEGTSESFYVPFSRVIWNAWMKRDVGRGWQAGLELDNLLNRRYYDIAEYDKPPLSVSFNLNYNSFR